MSLKDSGLANVFLTMMKPRRNRLLLQTRRIKWYNNELSPLDYQLRRDLHWSACILYKEHESITYAKTKNCRAHGCGFRSKYPPISRWDKKVIIKEQQTRVSKLPLVIKDRISCVTSSCRIVFRHILSHMASDQRAVAFGRYTQVTSLGNGLV